MFFTLERQEHFMIAKYFVEFIVYSFLGWMWECFYCCVVSKHWTNRGFLYGPVCPIYGVGAILCSVIFEHASLTISGTTPLWEVFVICTFGSAVLEYTTSFLLEKFFHALWWDYSNIPFNIHGRICLPVMFCFGAAGIVVVKFILPAADHVKAGMQPVFAESLALFLMAVFAADIALSVESLVDLTQRLDTIETGLNNKIEETYQVITEMPKELRERYDLFAERLTDRQRYSLYSIKKYTSKKTGNAASRFRLYLDQISERIHRDNH